MNFDSQLTRRSWLRSSAMTLGAAGVLSSVRTVAAAPALDDNNPGIFNVLAFGAKGDGAADDTDAIQKAIDAAQNYTHGNVNRGGIVFLPTGVYLVSKTLLITNEVKIMGQGQATIDGATHLVPASLGFDVIKMVNVNWGVVLEGFHIKAYSYTGSGGHFLRIQACQHVRIREVHLINCWNGALVGSSGDVNFYDVNVSGADVPGEGRFGIKCTAASPGNANATQALNCVVSQWGKNVRSMDGFVLANGYNSLSAINCGALNCNRAFWSTKDGGTAPNFFVVSLGCSDHGNTGVQLDDGGFTQFSDLLVTSSYVDNIVIGENITGPVAFSNCVVSTSGGNQPPDGAGYRIHSHRRCAVSITGGSVHDTAGHGLDISGDGSVVATGVTVSAIQSGQNADGVRVSGGGDVTLTGLAMTGIKNTALRVLADFKGALTFGGIAQHNADRGLYDEGSAGVIRGDGSFATNFTMDVDISRNQNAATCIKTHGSTPWPFNPTPGVPAPGSPVRNTTGTHCLIYLTGRKINHVAVDGVKLGAPNPVYLPVNTEIVVDYSGDLKWVWQRVT